MAKQQSLPRIDDAPQAPEQPPVPQVAEPSGAVDYPGYVPRRVDVKLPIRHRKILHAKLRILQDSGARLADGTEVSDRTKAVLWILENEVKV